MPQKSSRQRSVPRIDFGPLLFILYINDMSQYSSLKMVHYADDSTAYDFGTDICVLTNKINFELRKVDEWLRANKLSLNIAKSFFSVFSNMKNYFVSNISIRGQNLHIISQNKFRGVLIHDRLRFSDNINQICKKSKPFNRCNQKVICLLTSIFINNFILQHSILTYNLCHRSVW